MIEDYKGIWIYAEYDQSKIKNVTFELLSKSLELASILNEEVSCVLVGADIKKFVSDLAAYGATKVYLSEDPSLKIYSTEAYANIITKMINTYKPSVFLIPATKLGRDLAPRISAAVGTGLTADCTNLKILDRNLLQVRPAYGGNIMAEIIAPEHRPQMSTVRPNVFKKIEPMVGKTAQIIEMPATPGLLKMRAVVKEIISTVVAGVKKIDESDVIVSVGRGVGTTKESLADIQQLADLLGAAMGCSRVIVDIGLMPKTQQIGQSGITVSPKLYIACGISGTIQHIVGMKESKMIVAINKDPNAPIFNVADYGIVGDVHTVVPVLLEELKKALKNN